MILNFPSSEGGDQKMSCTYFTKKPEQLFSETFSQVDSYLVILTLTATLRQFKETIKVTEEALFGCLNFITHPLFLNKIKTHF